MSTIDVNRPNANISRLTNLRDRFLYLLLSELGLTVSEIVNLKISQFIHHATNNTQNTTHNTIQIGSRIISLSTQLSQTYNDYVHTYKPQTYVFFTRQSPQMTPRRIQQILQSYQFANPQELRREAVISSLQEKSVEVVREQFNLKSLRSKQYLTEEEFELLESQISSKRDTLIARILYETGITVSQLVDIKHVDISKKGILVAVDERLKEPKTKIPISNTLYTLISQFQSNVISQRESSQQLHSKQSFSPFLFSSRQSDQFSVRRIEQILNSYSSVLGLTLTPQIIANSFRVHSCSHSKLCTHKVSQHIPRLYEGYFSQKKNGGENEIT